MKTDLALITYTGWYAIKPNQKWKIRLMVMPVLIFEGEGGYVFGTVLGLAWGNILCSVKWISSFIACSLSAFSIALQSHLHFYRFLFYSFFPSEQCFVVRMCLRSGGSYSKGVFHHVSTEAGTFTWKKNCPQSGLLTFEYKKPKTIEKGVSFN